MKDDYGSELEKNGAIGFVPNGNSMWPIIKNHKHSVILLKKKQKLNKYDVAMYTRADGSYVLHRVIEVTEQGYIMCGDSQFTLEPVLEDKVIGYMSGFYCGKKYIEADDKKYRRRVDNWYKRKTIRKIRLKFFYLRVRIKGKLKRIFVKKKQKGE